ncbi:hypothetical protein G1H11_09310 [Phytoactinopolyspora alkaliphila]|uniref:Benzoate transporter n=1 Tax=Phytoactinopolyspora alkaliphila TaxID=1783498 RepID=A0A6N9YKR7_9ACTN|nr:beta-propeller domain-containing protein [Phytoactinopolyspora alkaliphila]NED95510.1 hypothetical protein [Phytoactinopolyspora alkaliphila]
MRTRLGILLGCGLAAGTLVAINVIPAGEAVATGLVSFGACSDVVDHLKDEGRERVGPWGLMTGGPMMPFEMETTDDAVAADGAGADSAGGTDGSYSSTNVQEAGVDEPDIVKTDGRLIVTTMGSNLQVIDTTDGAPAKIGELSLGQEYAEGNLLLSGDRALVFVRGYAEVAGEDEAVEPDYFWEQPTTSVLLVDLSSPANPTVISSLEVDGNYIDARLVDGTARLVISSAPRVRFPALERHYVREPDEEELVKLNREAIDDSGIDDWLPSYRLEAGGEESTGRLVECDQLNRPSDFAGFTTLSVLTVGFDQLTAGDAVGVLTDGDTVYASADQLYVATAKWGEPSEAVGAAVDWMGPWWPRIDKTGIHAFDIRGDGPARYLASGDVDGELIGQYAMSEHDSVLRVATTTDAWDESKSESHLFTLTEQGSELAELGRVSGLGKSERIYAVRYFGDTAYVVTFRQVDPLYVLDLADPANPSVEGELKITGYSSYLHPIGEDRLIGIGQEATESGRTVGTQVSLFDVSDPASPGKLDGVVKEDAWSEAESNPHAFLYWPETRQLVVPIHGFGLAEPLEAGPDETNDDAVADDQAMADESGGALVLGVGETSLSEQGLITNGRPESEREDYYWSSIMRSLVIGDALYTLWHDGLQVNDLDDLDFQSWLTLSSAW